MESSDYILNMSWVTDLSLTFLNTSCAIYSIPEKKVHNHISVNKQ